MAVMTMSLPALYEYAKNVQNIDIFEQLSVPASVTRDDVIDRILIKSAPFECTYPDATYMHAAVGNWSRIHARTFNKWADALAISYDPLNNYDRTEVFNESGIENNNRSANMYGYDNRRINDTTLDDLTTNRTDTSKSNSTTVGSNDDTTDVDSTTINSVSAFDSSTFSNSDKSDVDSTTTTNSSNMQATNGSQTDRSDGADSRFTANNTYDSVTKHQDDTSGSDLFRANNHRLRAYGNIGVTTSQQMLQSELEISEWNIYEHIADLFIDEFCVLLY